MALAYADVSARTLRLSLVSGATDIEIFNPVCRATIQTMVHTKSVAIEVGILGASHFMQVSEGHISKPVLTEVFACAEPATDLRRIFLGPLGDDGVLGPIASTASGIFDYTFEATAIPWSVPSKEKVDEIAAAVERAGNKDGQNIGLAFQFPSPNEQTHTDQLPVTLVLLEPAGGAVQLRTVHSYPNEGVVVFTESKIQGKERT